MSVGALAFVVVVAAMFSAGLATERKRIALRDARFKGRELVELAELHRGHYAERGISYDRFAVLWAAVGRCLKIDPRLLRPTDSFDVELSPVPGFLGPDELGDLEDFYRDEWRRSHETADPPHLQTLDDLVRTLL